MIAWHPRSRTVPNSSTPNNSGCARALQLVPFYSGVTIIPDEADPADHSFGPGTGWPIGFSVEQYFYVFGSVKSWRVQSTFPDAALDLVVPVQMDLGGMLGPDTPAQSDMFTVGGAFATLRHSPLYFHQGKLFPMFYWEIFVGGAVQATATSWPPPGEFPVTGALKILDLETPLYDGGFQVPQDGDIIWKPEELW